MHIVISAWIEHSNCRLPSSMPAGHVAIHWLSCKHGLPSLQIGINRCNGASKCSSNPDGTQYDGNLAGSWSRSPGAHNVSNCLASSKHTCRWMPRSLPVGHFSSSASSTFTNWLLAQNANSFSSSQPSVTQYGLARNLIFGGWHSSMHSVLIGLRRVPAGQVSLPNSK